MQYIVYLPVGKQIIRRILDHVNSFLKKALKKGADNIEGQEENDRYYADKSRNGAIFAGQYPVYLPASLPLPAFPRFDDRGIHKPVYK